jgi:hypothetical protein
MFPFPESSSLTLLQRSRCLLAGHGDKERPMVSLAASSA